MSGSSKILYVLVVLVFTKNFLTVETLKNSPACHLGIMRLFQWCEQSECSNCTCLSKNHVCKQICNKKKCALLFCSSPQTCYQSVMVEFGKRKPVVEKLISYTPITQQDCSQATCKLMKAVRYSKTVSRSFQSCSEGKCGEVYSDADIAKQFCGDCDRMTCTGVHAKNCTQLCVFGQCKNITCNAKHCKQLCSHDSTCHLTCGPNAKTCEQTCNHGSTCSMKCLGKSCMQKCENAKNCTVIPIPTTTTEPTTTAATTTTTTTKRTTTEIDNNIVVIEKDKLNPIETEGFGNENNNNIVEVGLSTLSKTESSAAISKTQPVFLLTLTILAVFLSTQLL